MHRVLGWPSLYLLFALGSAMNLAVGVVQCVTGSATAFVRWCDVDSGLSELAGMSLAMGVGHVGLHLGSGVASGRGHPLRCCWLVVTGPSVSSGTRAQMVPPSPSPCEFPSAHSQNTAGSGGEPPGQLAYPMGTIHQISEGRKSSTVCV